MLYEKLAYLFHNVYVYAQMTTMLQNLALFVVKATKIHVID